MRNNRRILQHFGIQEKPLFVNDTFMLYAKDVQNAITYNEMMAMCGPTGAGKTEVFKYVAMNLRSDPDRQPYFVRVANKDKERLKIGSIISAIIWDISNENPRRDLEARSRQVVRLLGKVVVERKRHVCIVIEEAHRLHANTLRALKELREDDFAGVSPLFSVLLIGHDELEAKLETRMEVFWRSQILPFTQKAGWMSYSDRITYLRTVYGQAITQKARQRIAALYNVPLAMEFYVERKMDEAYRAGLTQLSEDAFEASAMEMKKALKVSLEKIAQEAQIGKTTVHDALHNPAHKKSEAVVSALHRLAEKKRQEEDAEKIAKVA